MYKPWNQVPKGLKHNVLFKIQTKLGMDYKGVMAGLRFSPAFVPPGLMKPTLLRSLSLSLSQRLAQVRAVRALPDGRLASASQDRTAMIWASKNGVSEGAANMYYEIGGINKSIVF